MILLGKVGSGMEIVGKSLLGNSLQEQGQHNENPNPNGSLGKPPTDTRSEGNALSLVIKDVQRSNPHPKLNRDIKVTYVCLDDIKSSKDLSTLSISQDYSVLFCFPVSDRFTTEDLNLLQTYLKYRQREDFEQVRIAFTYSERFEDDQITNEEEYLANLPAPLNDVLKKCGHKYMFFNSDVNKNESNVKLLFKPLPCDEFSKKLIQVILVFCGFHIF